MAFPTTAIACTIEVALGADLSAAPSTWSWTDATAYVYERAPVVIERGRADGFGHVPPSTLSLTVDNRDGRWSPRNPLGAWYGQIGRNTPIRVSTSEGSTSRRFIGFISELPPRWDVSEADAYVPVRADGILRRIQQGQTPLRSALVRAHLASVPVAYWPCEDGSGATQLASGVAGAPNMRYAGTITIGAQGPAGSAAAVELSTDTQMHAYLPVYTDTGEWTVSNVLEIPAAVASETVVLAWSTLGSLYVWRLLLTPGSPDTLSLVAYTPSGTVIINDSTTFVADLLGEPYGRPVRFWCRAEQSGSDIDYEYGYGFDGSDGAVTGTATTQTLGIVTTVAEYPSSNLDNSTVGHFAVWDRLVDPIESAGLADALDGYDGETAYNRRSRLGVEEGIPVSFTGAADENPMGPQRPGSWLDLVREVEAVSGGILYEVRATASHLLHVLAADGIASAAVAMTVDYSAGELAHPFEPAGDDDQGLINDFTATRPDGSTARVTDDDHIDASGRYDSSGEFVTHTDDQLTHLASWQVHLGTVDEQRYPAVRINLARSPGLIASWLTVDIGSRIRITNLTSLGIYGPVDLLVHGYTETITWPKGWDVELNCTPYLPYNIFTLADPTGDSDPFLGHLDVTSCVLAEALDTTETGVDVTTSPLWSTDGDDDPWDIIVGGERMTVTAVSGSSNPQTLTVTRSVNGVVKSHSNGAAVELHPESATYLGL